MQQMIYDPTRAAAGEPHLIHWFAAVEVAQVIFPLEVEEIGA